MEQAPLFSAVILAAGLSSRLGCFKPMVPLGDRTLIERAVDLFRSAGIRAITVVIGHRAEDIRPVVAGLNVKSVVNPDYASGMFSSVCRGIAGLDSRYRAFFMLPVDVALVRPATVRTLIHAFGQQPNGKIFYPVFGDHKGHPPLIDTGLIPEILDWNGTGGLAGFLENRSPLSVDVPVADEAILWDLDTPADLQRLEKMRQTRNILSPEACRVLMENVCRLPAPVVAHCRAVAKIARAMAAAVNRGGAAFDVDRIYAAALVHDVARLHNNHAQKGAQLLADLGYPQLAEIVRVHMDIRVDPAAALSESEIVHLADKLVSGDRPVDLNERFHRKMEKYGRNRAATISIERRKQNALLIKAKVERTAGCSLDAIVGPADPAKGGQR